MFYLHIVIDRKLAHALHILASCLGAFAGFAIFSLGILGLISILEGRRSATKKVSAQVN